MGARGPKPQGQLRVVPEVGQARQERPAPLPGMNTRARAMWRKIVASLPPEHFKAGDLPLLREYCEAYDRSVRAQQALNKDGDYIPTGTGSLKAHPAQASKTAAAHTMAALATKLRICANSRMSGKQVEDEPAQPKSKRAGLMFGE